MKCRQTFGHRRADYVTEAFLILSLLGILGFRTR